MITSTLLPKHRLEFLAQAIEVWSKDSRVKPSPLSLLIIPISPFDHFSWVDKTETLYPESQQMWFRQPQNTPTQTTSYQLNYIHLPLLLLHNIEYQGTISLKNTVNPSGAKTSFCLNPIFHPISKPIRFVSAINNSWTGNLPNHYFQIYRHWWIGK
jgi:hypothetical protein